MISHILICTTQRIIFTAKYHIIGTLQKNRCDGNMYVHAHSSTAGYCRSTAVLYIYDIMCSSSTAAGYTPGYSSSTEIGRTGPAPTKIVPTFHPLVCVVVHIIQQHWCCGMLHKWEVVHWSLITIAMLHSLMLLLHTRCLSSIIKSGERRRRVKVSYISYHIMTMSYYIIISAEENNEK